MAGKHLMQEEVQKIRELSAQGLTQREIAVAIGRSQAAVHRAQHNTNEQSTSRRCPGCHRKLPDVKGMAFCQYCAEDVRSPGRKAAYGLVQVLNNISKFYPQNLRDDAIAALNNAIKILEEAD